jgi:hypothetical protein
MLKEIAIGKPTANMIVQAGVELRDREKLVTGPEVQYDNRLSLKEYRKLDDPKI